MSRHPSKLKAPPEPVSPSRRDPIEDWLDLLMRMLSLPKSESAAVRDELEDHLRSRVDDLLITGSSEHDAVLQAVGELGETAELARRFKQASHPSRRRQFMSTALIAIAGSALTLGAFTVFNPPTNVVTLTSSAGGAGPVATFVAPPGEAAPFDDKLKKYDISVFFAPDLDGQWGRMSPEERVESIRDTIYNLVSSDDWDDMGGEDASLAVTGNTMFITGDEKIHQGAGWVLDTLIADLNKEREAYEKALAKEEAANQDLDAQRKAAEERDRDEWERALARKRAEAAAIREHQIMELREQYAQLKETYLDITRERTLMDLQENDLERAWREAEGDKRESAMMKLAETRARSAETDLRYSDTRERLERVSSLLMDLELAEYQPTPKATVGYAPQPSPAGAPQASATPDPSSNPLSAR